VHRPYDTSAAEHSPQHGAAGAGVQWYLGPIGYAPQQPSSDFADIRGHAHAKRALEIAPAGAHNVMVTGSGEVDVVATALAAGADDVLYKPVDVVILVDTVNKCVERGRRRRS